MEADIVLLPRFTNLLEGALLDLDKKCPSLQSRKILRVFCQFWHATDHIDPNYIDITDVMAALTSSRWVLTAHERKTIKKWVSPCFREFLGVCHELSRLHFALERDDLSARLFHALCGMAGVDDTLIAALTHAGCFRWSVLESVLSVDGVLAKAEFIDSITAQLQQAADPFYRDKAPFIVQFIQYTQSRPGTLDEA